MLAVIECAVDVPETIDELLFEIQEEDPYYLLVTLRKSQRLGQECLEQYAIGQTGQTVIVSQVAGAE